MMSRFLAFQKIIKGGYSFLANSRANYTTSRLGLSSTNGLPFPGRDFSHYKFFGVQNNLFALRKADSIFRSNTLRRFSVVSARSLMTIHAQAAWRRLCVMYSYRGITSSSVSRIAFATSFAVTRSHLIPTLLAFVAGEVAFSKTAWAEGEYFPTGNALYMRENDADSSNDTNLSSATDDDEEDIGDSESASSERAELEPEDELEVGKGDCELIKGGERIRKERRNTAVHPDNNTCTPHKLKFRRGRTIELEPESNGPRRLRFRRRRTVDASVNGVQLERKKFQRNEITQAADDTSLESQSVVLKHQDMQEKKDAQGLFNNVIEETASKLVETRKSKVKALVGAFETVISLQDSKPESTA